MKNPIVTILAALFFTVPQLSLALTDEAPNIPSSLDYYGFLHTNYDAANNDLKDFLSYTNTGFAGDPSQVPLLVAAGFKNIVYVTNHFSPGYSPLLDTFVQREGIQLNGVSIQDYDYRKIPDYKTKMLGLYREQLTDLRNQLVANGTLDRVSMFYIADEPALHRNYIPDQDFLNSIDATFKSVFPGKRSTIAFAEDRSGTNPFRGAHMDPPPTLDAISMDPYFDNPDIDCSEDSVRNYLYNTHPNSAISWAFQWGKPVYWIGDAMLRNKQPRPLCYAADTFNLAKKDPRIKGLIWFIYDVDNLDGGTYLSGAAGSPTLVNLIKSLTITTATTSGTIIPTPRVGTQILPTGSSQCLNFANNLFYGEDDYDDNGMGQGDVLKLQQYLFSQGLLKAQPNGYYGRATFGAVKAFQSANGILRTGNVGPLTRAGLARVTGCGMGDSTDIAATPQTAAGTDANSPSLNTNVAAPAINISSATTTAYGGRVVIAWNVVPSTNVNCTATGEGLVAGSGVNSMGTWITPELHATSVYTMRCTNTASGQSTTKSVTITVPQKQPDSSPKNTPVTSCPSGQTVVNGSCVSSIVQEVINPAVSLSSSASSIMSGRPVTLTWTSSNATKCMIQNLTTGSFETVSANDSKTYYPSLATYYQLYCQNDPLDGRPAKSAYKSVYVDVTNGTALVAAPAPTINSLYAYPTSVVSGQGATIYWNASNAAQCFGQNMTTGTIQTLDTYGSIFLAPTVTTSYKLWCTNGAGVSVEKVIPLAVTSPATQTTTADTNTNTTTTSDTSTSLVAPSITLSPDMTTTFGGTATLTWNVTPPNGASCISAGGNLANGTTMSASGSWTTPPLYTTTQYGMRCTNTAGLSTTKYVTVTVTQPSAPTISLSSSATNNTVSFGGSATISWNVTPATNVSCVSVGGNVASGSVVGPNGSWTTPPLYTTTQYGMRCTDNSSGLSSYQYITINVPAQTSQSSAPVISTTGSGTIQYGSRATITWNVTPSTNVSCVVAGGELPAGTAVGTSGTWTSSPLYTSTQYAMQCTDNSTGAVGYGYVNITIPSQSNAGGPSSFTINKTASAVLGASTQCTDLSLNMHRGYESLSVIKLQNFLKSIGILDETTGFYGDKTVTAIKEYQASKNLPQTGMVYDATRAAIRADSCQ